MNADPRPHSDRVNPIVAASSDVVRRELLQLTRDANLDVRAVAGDPTELARLLGSNGAAWVVTGGSLSQARPFLSAGRTGHAAVVAVLSGRMEAEQRSDLDYGGLAVLRAVPPTETLEAAIIASRAGLSVWDPDLGFPAEVVAEPHETPLSPRERTVLELTGAGLSTKVVARQLGISPNTVKYHLQAAFEKLGASSRAGAVIAAIRRGEISV